MRKNCARKAVSLILCICLIMTVCYTALSESTAIENSGSFVITIRESVKEMPGSPFVEFSHQTNKNSNGEIAAKFLHYTESGQYSSTSGLLTIEDIKEILACFTFVKQNPSEFTGNYTDITYVAQDGTRFGAFKSESNSSANSSDSPVKGFIQFTTGDVKRFTFDDEYDSLVGMLSAAIAFIGE